MLTLVFGVHQCDNPGAINPRWAAPSGFSPLGGSDPRSGATWGPHYRGKSLAPIRYSSTELAAWRPSRIAQTTRAHVTSRKHLGYVGCIAVDEVCACFGIAAGILVDRAHASDCIGWMAYCAWSPTRPRPPTKSRRLILWRCGSRAVAGGANATPTQAVRCAPRLNHTVAREALPVSSHNSHRRKNLGSGVAYRAMHGSHNNELSIPIGFTDAVCELRRRDPCAKISLSMSPK